MSNPTGDALNALQAEPRPRGRQSTFTQEIADKICEGLLEGKSLRKVCAEEGMPGLTTVLDWVNDPRYQSFSEQYTRARTRQYELMAEEIMEISDDSKGDTWIDDQGNERTDAERVARSKLRVDSRKWMLSKMLPKIYGDKLETTIKGEMKVSRDLTDAELANIAAGVSKA